MTIFNNYKAYRAAQAAGQRNIKFISAKATPAPSASVSPALRDTISSNQAYYF